MEERIKAALMAEAKVVIANDGLVPSAVVLPLFRHEDDYATLFIRRTLKVNTHKGEYCFPGGVKEADDPDLAFTALREFQEELGVSPEDVKLLGELDDVRTIGTMRISPFVGLIPHPYAYVPNPDEVDIVVEIPLAHLVRPGVRTVEQLQHPDGSVRAVTFYRLGEHVIWGATGRILDHFFKRIGRLA